VTNQQLQYSKSKLLVLNIWCNILSCELLGHSDSLTYLYINIRFSSECWASEVPERLRSHFMVSSPGLSYNATDFCLEYKTNKIHTFEPYTQYSHASLNDGDTFWEMRH
jgi:hypothetical protein